MFIKIMSNEDKADHDQTKLHQFYDVSNYTTYVQHSDSLNVGPSSMLCMRIELTGGGFTSLVVTGNVYVMNADGKTINTISCNVK